MAELASEKRQIAEALRNIVLNADSGLRETIKWGNPTLYGAMVLTGI